MNQETQNETAKPEAQDAGADSAVVEPSADGEVTQAKAASDEASTQSAPRPTERPAAPASRSLLGGVALFAVLLVAIAATAGGYWLHQRLGAVEAGARAQIQTAVDGALTAQTTEVNAQLTAVAQQLEQVRQAMAEQVRQFETQTNEARNARQSLQADVEGRLAAVDAQQARIDALQSRMDTLLERINTLRREQQPTVMLRWQAARDLLGVGRLQAERLQNLSGALQHYRAARQLLLEQADTNSAQVIALLDEELQRLAAVQPVDSADYAGQIQDSLPLLAQWQPQAAVAEPQQPDAEAGWWDKLRYNARRVITVRRAEALDKVDVEIVRQALRLHLLAAQAALVARDQAAVNRHAQHAFDLLQDFAADESAELAPLVTLLPELAQLDFAVSLPPMGQAEERLQQLLRSASDQVAP